MDCVPPNEGEFVEIPCSSGGYDPRIVGKYRKRSCSKPKVGQYIKFPCITGFIIADYIFS
jgi:hypothetical protein